MTNEPTKVTTIDVIKDGIMLPPAPHLCQKCAVQHEPQMPTTSSPCSGNTGFTGNRTAAGRRGRMPWPIAPTR